MFNYLLVFLGLKIEKVIIFQNFEPLIKTKLNANFSILDPKNDEEDVFCWKYVLGLCINGLHWSLGFPTTKNTRKIIFLQGVLFSMWVKT